MVETTYVCIYLVLALVARLGFLLIVAAVIYPHLMLKGSHAERDGASSYHVMYVFRSSESLIDDIFKDGEIIFAMAIPYRQAYIRFLPNAINTVLKLRY